MKKIILLATVALFFSAFVQAQIVTINGRVVNSFAAGLFQRTVALTINAGNPAGSFNDTLLTDSMGYFYNTYSVAPGLTSGSVIATTACGNSFVTSVANWSPATNGVANFGNIICSSSPAPVNSSICGMVSPLAAGDTAKIELYSLRFGAVTLDTTIYRIDTLSAGWTAYCFSVSAGNYRVKAGLTAGSTNAATYFGTWFGNTTNPSNALSVSVSNAVSIQNVNIQLQTVLSPPVTTIFGNITGYTSTAPGISDTLQAVVIQLNNGIWTPIDTVYAIDSSGNAWFTAHVNRIGVFSVLAQLRSGNAANYVPTYYGNATTWSAADSFTLLNNGATAVFTITLQPVTGTGGGGGGVGGGVNGNLPITGSVGLAGVQVQLKNTQGAILRYVHSNTAGLYNMNNLPDGTYELRVEMMGIQSSVWNFTIDPANPFHNVHFNVGSNGISTSVFEQEVRIGKVYPNPAREIIQVVLNGMENVSTDITLRDLQGRKVKSVLVARGTGEQIVSFPLEGVQPGLYLLETSGRGSKVHKVLVY